MVSEKWEFIGIVFGYMDLLFGKLFFGEFMI